MTDSIVGIRAHTPGPWKVFETPTGKVVGIGRQSDGYAVADAGFGVWGEQSDEASANARLIAAAPDLLEACKRAEQFIRNGRDLGFIRMPDASTPDPAHYTPSIIAAAIAKAEGRVKHADAPND